jgi:HPt (histidine-containing phosphotransfer) domain-containing protein
VIDSLTAPISESWDQKDFESTISGDMVLGTQLIDDYRSQTSTLMYHTEQAIRCRDYQELRRIGHTLKGSSAAISANSLAKYGGLINSAAKQADIESIRKSYGAFKEAFAIFELSSEKWKKQHERTEKSED